MAELHRVQLDFSDAGFRELKEITAASGCKSNAATIRNALAFYRWYLDTIKNGEDVLVRPKDGTPERMKFVFVVPSEAAPSRKAVR